MKTGSILLASTAAMIFPIASFAQSAPLPTPASGAVDPAPSQPQNEPLTVAAPDAAPQADNSGLADIVVTAQRRSENIQRVPIAITAATAEQLTTAHIQSTADLGSLMPGLRVGNSAGAGLFFLRGIGQTSGAPGVISPIATYLDGIYIGIARLSAFDLNGIDQISLLRGPQGSLFGRNASGGLIQVTTKDPGSQPEGNMTLGYANYNTLSGSLYASGPLTDTLSANLSLKGRKEFDGWIYNITTKRDLLREEQYSGQAKLLWRPDAATDVTLNFIYQYAANFPGVVGGPTPGYLAIDGTTRYIGEYTVANGTDGTDSTETKIASLRIRHDLGWAEFSNLAHGIWSAPKFLAEQSGIPGRPNPNNAPEQASALDSKVYAFGDDVQLSSPTGGGFQWIVGLSYERELTKSLFNVYLDKALAQYIKSRYTSEAFAGFAQVTKNLFDHTRLTLGGRYTTDTLSLSGITSTGLTPQIGGIPTSKTYNQFTWRVSLDQDITPDILMYGSVNRGFKSGQYSIVAFTNNPVEPEIVTAYEVGVKSQLFDRHLRFNAALFLQDMNNLQLRALNGAAVVLFNAASARTYGADIDFNAVLTDELSINGGLEWLPHANYESFPGGLSVRQTPIAATPPGCTGTPNLRNGGTASFICDLSGNRMIMAPKVSLNLGFTYTKRTDIGTFVLNAADSYSGRVFVDPDHSTSAVAYHLVSASLNYELPDSHWNIRLWGTNLAAARNYWNAQYIHLPGEPRRFGVEVGLKF